MKPVILLVVLCILFPQISNGQKISYKDLLGTWDGYWEVNDTMQRFPKVSFEFTDSLHGIWWPQPNEAMKFTYSLTYLHGGIYSSEITDLNMHELNKQSKNWDALAVITINHPDTLLLLQIIDFNESIPKIDTLSYQDSNSFNQTAVKNKKVKLVRRKK